jgi:hypothetical protein
MQKYATENFSMSSRKYVRSCAISVFACLFHFFTAAQTTVIQPINPEGWAKEQAFFSQRRVEFLDHVKGAKKLVIAKGYDGVTSIVVGYDGIRNWKIDWKAQRAFCTRITNVVFKNQHQMSFPEPNFSMYRDPAEKILELPALSYPTCSFQSFQSIKLEKERQEEIKQKNLDWLTLSTTQVRYYSSPQFQMYEELYPILDDSPNPKVIGRKLSLEYSAGLDERGCHLWGGRFQDHNENRDVNSKVVAGVIDGEFVFFEFGKYGDKTGLRSEAQRKGVGEWWGKPGQRYLLATGARHNLNHTLMIGRGHDSQSISSGAFPSARGIAPYEYGNACVFNFDAIPPTTGRNISK